MITLKRCPLCNNDNFIKKLNCIDFSTSHERFTIVSCETCMFTFTNPRPIDQNLGKYYESDMYISHTNNKKGFFNFLYQNIRLYTIKSKLKILEKITKKGVHLDIGCGTGEFLHACKKAGFKTKGVEPAKNARLKAITNFNLDVSSKTDLSNFNDRSINSISMWHVLEHVTDINKQLENLFRILSVKGKIIIAVPNHKSWDANFYKKYWAAWDVPIHLWHFSKETVELLFKKHGFKLLDTKPMIFDSFYVSLLSEEYKYGRKKFIKSFIIGFISNINGMFTKKGYSSHIYIFEKAI